MIRAIPTNTTDRVLCKVLGQGAVHGAFAGFTGFTVGLVNTHYVYLPIGTIIQVIQHHVVLTALEWHCAILSLFMFASLLSVVHYDKLLAICRTAVLEM